MVPPEPHTEAAKEVFWLYNVVLVMGAIVFVGVEGFILYSVFRYRRRDDRLPTQIHGNNLVEMIWTAIPTVIVLILFVLSTLTLNSISRPPSHTPASHRGRGEPVVSGSSTTSTTTATRQRRHRAGDSPQRRRSWSLPVGEPVRLMLVSNDVIHSFFVPAFLVKRDLVPLPGGEDPERARVHGQREGDLSRASAPSSAATSTPR